MELQVKQAIVNQAKDFLNTKNLSQTDLAKKANLRKEYLTHMLKENSAFVIPAGNGKTVEIADKYFKRLAEFIGYSLVKTYWENKLTPQLTTIIANLEDAKRYGKTKLFIGETGSGKTHAINLFLRKHPADTFLITVSSTDNLSDLIDKIIDVLKITTGKTKSKKLRDIAFKLRAMKEDGHEPQLIFDEAEYMKQPALAALKALFDYLDKYCSIILVGTDQLIHNINVLRRKNKQGMPQFYRRIKFGIIQLPAVDRTFKLFLNGIKDNETKKFLRKICDNYGELHDVMVPVLRESERTGEQVSESLIRKVLNLSTMMYA